MNAASLTEGDQVWEASGQGLERARDIEEEASQDCGTVTGANLQGSEL